MAKKLKITQVRSIVGSQREKHRKQMQSLGFTKNYRTLYKNDTPQIRGMMHKVRHLIEWEEIDEKDIPSIPGGRGGFTILEAGPGPASPETAAGREETDAE